MPTRLPLLSGLPRKTFRLLALAAALAATALPALAGCTIPPGDPDEATLERLIGALPDCQRDAQYLAGLGNILNHRGRYLEAGDHLERALMLAPDLKGAQLDYAIALAGLGEVDSARMLLDQVLADPTLPLHLRPVLERQRRAWASATDWHTRVTVGARFGYDSNLLGAPNLSSLTLTFPDASLVLPLDESALPKSGSYQRLDLQVESRKQTLAGGQIEGFVGLRTRRSPVTSDADAHHVDAVAEYSNYRRRNNGAGFFAAGSAALVRGGSGIRYNALGVSAGAGTAHWLAGCDARLGLEVQERRYLNNDLLSGRYGGVAGSVTCERQALQWLASAKAGRDAARRAERPGGDQTQYSLRGAVVANSPGPAWLAAGRLWLDLEIAESRDSSGYSPLLESGRSRVVRRSTARIEYQRPLGRLQWAVGAERVMQRSNLALFASRSWGPYVSVRGAW